MMTPVTNHERARQLLALARQQWRETTAAAAIEAAESAVTLFREAAQAGIACAPELSEALWFLADCCQDARSSRAGEVWKEYVACARTSEEEGDLEVALARLGECDLAATADRLEAWRELAAIHEAAGRDGHLACALESRALLLPLNEAVALIDEAGRLRAALESTSQPTPAHQTLDALFERLREANRPAALAVARLQVLSRRGQTPSETTLLSLAVPLRLGDALERVADVADEEEARQALREALELFRRVCEGTGQQFGSTRLQRVEEKLRKLEGDVSDAGRVER